MADYVVRVEASTEEAEKKLKRVDQKVVKLEKGATIDIKLPTAEQTLSTLGKIASATASIGKQALAISRAANIGPGAVINDLDDLFGIVSSGAKKSISAMEMLRKATPQNILGSSFEVASNQATALAQRISNIGYEIFGVTQSVNILRQAFGGMFDETVGREIRLQESLLRTRTTLASTADVAVNGKRLTDPFQALMALEGPVEEALQNIRRRSLDIAGTTSDAIVQVFGVVASQVGAFGGTIKDAEDLAITFAGALGTIGMSDPMLATQEIRSILTGNIDQNSVLARSLGLTNEEITKAKTSSEGLVAFLERRLAAFTAGQKLAAQGFAGLVSNIQEVKEEAARSLGKPLLQPLLDSLTVVYQRLQLVFDQILSIADGLGRIGSAAFSGLMGGIGAAPILQGFDARSQIAAFDAVNAKVAEIAVTVQQQIDSVRPLIAGIANEVIKAIAMVSDGLGALLQGFVAFKWEQLKIVVFQLTSVAKLLNSTIIPLLNQVLKLYGDILSQPIFQYLSQVKTSFDALEKIGVNSVIRLTYLIKYAFLDSIQTVIGWIKTAIEFIKATVDKTIKFIAASIETIGVKVNEIGKQIVAGTTQLVVKLVLTISGAIKSLGVILIQAAVALQQSSSSFAGLAVPLSSVGKALLGIDGAAKKAAAGIQNFGVQVSQALSKVEQSAQRAGGAIRNVGQIIAGKLGEAAGAAGGKLKDLIFGFVKFQAGLLAWQVVAAGALDLWSRWRRSQEQISERTRAELAVKRLSTTYADLGENASAATRALRDLEQSVVNTRIDSATKQYTDLIQRLKDIEEIKKPKNIVDALRLIGAGMNPENFDVKPRMTGKYTQETFAQAFARTKREQAAVVAQELQELEKFKKKAEAEDKAKQDVQILARERKDIETAIAEYRKQVEKDIADERFKTAQEVGKLEQSLLEERRRVERAELDRQLARQSEGLTGVQATLAQVLGDYERGLFDAQTEAQRRQFEAVQARENLEKSIADYKLKLEEQTERMRKRMGDFNRKVVDYEVAQRERAAKRTLEYTIKSARLATTGYIPGPNDKNKFMDALVGKGISAEKVLSYLYAGGATDLGVQPGADPKDIVSAVLTDPKFIGLQRLEQQGLTWEQALNGLTKRTLGQSMAGTFAIQSARDDFGLNRWYNKELPAPKPVTGFDSLTADNERFVAERRALGEQIQAATEKLSNALLELSRSETRANMIDQLSRTSLFTDVPKSVEIVKNNQDLVRDINLLGIALSSGSGKVTTLAQKLAELDTVATRSAETLATSTGVIKALPANQQKLLIQDITSIFSTALKTGKKTWNYDFEGMVKGFNLSQKELAKLGITADRFKQDFLATVSTVMSTLLEARQQVIQGAPLLDRNARLQALKNDAIEAASSLPDMLMNAKFEALTNLNSLSAGNSPLKQRLAEAQNINTARILKYSKDNGLSDAVVASQVRELNDQYTRAYRELGLFEEELKNATSRIALAKELAADIAAGYRNIFMAFAQGGDIQSAFTQMATGIQEKIVGSFMEYATRPLVDQLENTLLKALKAPSPEELAQKYRDALLQTNNTGLQNLNLTMQELPGKIATAISGAGTTANSPVATTPAGAPTTAGSPSAVTPEVAESNAAYAAETDKATQGMKAINSTTPDLTQKFTNLQKTLGGLITGIASIAMGFAGTQQMSGGGTYNTLMGLAGIFGALGSITGMFGTGGIFAGGGGAKGGSIAPGPVAQANGIQFDANFMGPAFRAAGGPVSANTPYMVGEAGPELFVPGASGTIIPNNRLSTSNYSATSDYINQTASASARMRNDPIKVETVNINSIEYATVDQLQKATYLAEQRGAERGRSMTMSSLQNSLKARKRIGMA